MNIAPSWKSRPLRNGCKMLREHKFLYIHTYIHTHTHTTRAVKFIFRTLRFRVLVRNAFALVRTNRRAIAINNVHPSVNLSVCPSAGTSVHCDQTVYVSAHLSLRLHSPMFGTLTPKRVHLLPSVFFQFHLERRLGMNDWLYKPSPIMPLHRVCKTIHLLSTLYCTFYTIPILHIFNWIIFIYCIYYIYCIYDSFYLYCHDVWFLPERDYVTFGSLLSQFRLSSVTLVHPTHGGWSFRQYFFTAVYAGHLWPPCIISRRSS